MPNCQSTDVTNTCRNYLHEKANINLILKAITDEEIGNNLTKAKDLLLYRHLISCSREL